MSDKKSSEPQFISAKDSEEWTQVLHGEITPSDASDVHKEAARVRQYLIFREESKALENLPDVDVLNTMTPSEAQVIYQNASREIRRRGDTLLMRLRDWLGTIVIGGLSAAVVFLWLRGPNADLPSQDTQRLSNKLARLNADGYRVLGIGDKPPKYPNMLLIEGGRMVMGCASGWDSEVGGCRHSEYPSHNVDVKSFEISQHEVTVGQFKAFVNATQYKTYAEIGARGCTYQDKTKPGEPFLIKPEYNWRNPGFAQDDTHPVTCISWHDAQAYIAWLNKETQRQYRLPSEAEWEFAARGGQATAFYWGSSAVSIHEYANTASEQDGWSYTAPVGNYIANQYSLHDTAGNVWEWVQDCWHETYDGAPKDGSSWETDCHGSKTRTRRGGGWDAIDPGARSAIRSKGSEYDRSNLYGFRIAHDYLQK